MDNSMLVEEVDFSIENMVMQKGEPLTEVDPVVLEMTQLAADLRELARPEFRQSLRLELFSGQPVAPLRRHDSLSANSASAARGSEQPRLFLAAPSTFPVQGRNFGTSVLIHAALLGIIIFSGFWTAHRTDAGEKNITSLVSPEVTSPPSPLELSGGGGGGDHSKVDASAGTPPKSAMRQIAPPIVVKRNADPALAAEESVVAPPDIHFKPSPNIGDPLSAVLAPSNGVGASSGVGSGSTGGVGSGEGLGVGAGWGAGTGGGVFLIGGGVSAPRFLSGPEPQYSEEARKAKFQGIVVLSAIVGPNGVPRELHVARSLGMGLDQKALEAVKQWRFEPGKKDGKPVSVLVNIEVSFRLY